MKNEVRCSECVKIAKQIKHEEEHKMSKAERECAKNSKKLYSLRQPKNYSLTRYFKQKFFKYFSMVCFKIFIFRLQALNRERDLVSLYFGPQLSREDLK